MRSLLGESAGEAAMLLLKESLGRDQFEVLWKSPKAVYDGMVRVFGEGAKVLVSILVLNISQEYGLKMRTEHFLELMRNGSQSALEEIHSFITVVAKAYKGG